MTSQPNESRHEKAKPHRKGRRVLTIVLIVLLIPTIVAGAALGLYHSGRLSLLGRGHDISVPESLVDDAQDDGRTVTYRGETYRFNDNVATILAIGVDKDDITAENGYGKNGQADSLFLIALDTTAGTTRIIPLSRDSLVDVDTYSADGTYIGVERTQLCLAYAYGANATESCRNVVRSVSRLLYGIDIKSCIAVDTRVIPVLTDAVGGVEVEALETVGNGAIKKGKTVRLTGDNALTYVRDRGKDADANSRRMDRQMQFLRAFLGQAADQLNSNFTKLESYYSAAKPYVVSDLTFPEITYLAGCALKGNIGKTMEYLNISGQTTVENDHSVFRADPNSLYEAVLAAFYIKEE